MAQHPRRRLIIKTRVRAHKPRLRRRGAVGVDDHPGGLESRAQPHRRSVPRGLITDDPPPDDLRVPETGEVRRQALPELLLEIARQVTGIANDGLTLDQRFRRG